MANDIIYTIINDNQDAMMTLNLTIWQYYYYLFIYLFIYLCVCVCVGGGGGGGGGGKHDDGPQAIASLASRCAFNFSNLTKVKYTFLTVFLHILSALPVRNSKLISQIRDKDIPKGRIFCKIWILFMPIHILVRRNRASLGYILWHYFSSYLFYKRI